MIESTPEAVPRDDLDLPLAPPAVDAPNFPLSSVGATALPFNRRMFEEEEEEDDFVRDDPEAAARALTFASAARRPACCSCRI